MATPDEAMGLDDRVVAVFQIWGVFLLLNVIWIVALLTVLRPRRTSQSFLVVLAMGVLWFGSYLFVCARIDAAVKDFDDPVVNGPRDGQPSSVDANDLATPAPPAK